MGKKVRKTRWRTLTIADDRSDSEESSTTTSGHRLPKTYSQKSYYNRYTYSSQSTPVRKYQYDGTKSTRSSSTASENKITFNEDEYTRITTPRQDVLFKKGYLNKPKSYQTQTSTGNSTTSTGNSTGNGTPDHQSTDLEYESQFVFPNGFVDQNGIYYVNSFEPYPVMIYNPAVYYPEFDANLKSKRCSTGSLTESMSPNTDETSQDLSHSQSETPNNTSEGNQSCNVIYPGFYYNGACQPPDATATTEPEIRPRRLKKRARRKPPRQEGTTSDSSSGNEEATDDERTPPQETEAEETETKTETEENSAANAKYDLKPDAEEFVPRAYRQQETIPMEANVQYIKIPSNFVPMPILNPMGEFNAFIPPGIPINFIPQNYVNFVPYRTHDDDDDDDKASVEQVQQAATTTTTPVTVEVPKKNQIDIAKIVSKLEEAAKVQDDVREQPGGKSIRKKRFQRVDLKPQPIASGVEKTVWKQSNGPTKKEAQFAPKRNYSETLKKTTTTTPQNFARNVDKSKTNKVATNQSATKSRTVRTEQQPKMPDEWIAVSNRKKRKNKNADESEEVDLRVEEKSDETKEETVTVALEQEPKVCESFQDVAVKVEKERKEEAPMVEEVVEETSAVDVECNERDGVAPDVELLKDEKKEKLPKRKSRRENARTQQPVTKRVIVTDVDLSGGDHEPEPVKAVEEAPIETTAADPVMEEQSTANDSPEPAPEPKESPEKKTKKKRKKVVRGAAASSTESCGSITVAPDDSYNFLLDESLEKTNVEMSHELDKMIQRGMYSSLEEKIRSMNIESNGNFFKSIINNISSRESSVEKNNFIKNPDLSKILNSSTFMKPKSGFEVHKADDFLGESTPEAVGGDDTTNRQTAANDDRDQMYPVTKAVKEWMTKRREATPDVELLKSPSAIMREFGEEEVNDERKSSISSAEEAEDVLETYESNESKRTKNCPKHGNLPFRAICCSIM